MNKKFSYILLSSFFVLFAFIAVCNLSANDKADNNSTFSNESPFDQSAFTNERVGGDHVLGGPPPPPPGADGNPITTPFNDNLFEIVSVLFAGMLFLLFRKKIFQLKI